MPPRIKRATSRDLLRAAQDWQGRGAVPIVIDPGRKKPSDPSWQTQMRRPASALAAEFVEGTNIGLVLGSPSGGLVDIDLDCPEAIVLAPHILPDTPLKHGRAGKPTTHWWYRVEGEAPSTHRRHDLDGVVLIELRGTGGQTVIPPSHYEPDPERDEPGGHLVWQGEGAWPLRIPVDELERRVNELAAGCLIARHWPGPGARHAAFLALAGGLHGLGWPLQRAVGFVVGIAATYDDPDETIAEQVTTTYRAAEEGRAVTGWTTLREHLGTVVVEQVLRWIGRPEAPDDDLVGQGLQFADLGGALLRPIPEVQWAIHEQVYPGSICWLQGEPGAGKTFLLCAWLLDALAAGTPVAYIDEEMGLEPLAERLQSLVPEQQREKVAEQMRSTLRYTALAGFTSEHRAALAEACNDLARTTGRPGLAFFDSASALLGNEGADEDDNSEVGVWISQVLLPLKKAGWAVVVIDHITKSQDGRGMYARGAGVKLAQSDNSWRVMGVAGKPFSANLMGRMLLRSMKDRYGHTPQEITYRIGGDGRGLSICERITGSVARPAGVASAVDGGGLDPLEERVLLYLAEHAQGYRHAVSTRKVRTHVQGDNAAIAEALRRLAVEEAVGVRTDEGAHGAAIWWHEPTEDEGVEIDMGST